MLAPVNDPKLNHLLDRLHSVVDVPGFFAAIRSILNEVMPHHREVTLRERALLHALHPHVEATARKVKPSSLGATIEAQPLATQIRMDEVQELLAQLTPAERDIVQLVREGWSNKEIACQLDKSVRTVKTQLTSVYKKCSVRSRGRLLAKLS